MLTPWRSPSRTLGLLKSLHGIAELQHFYLAGDGIGGFGHRLSIDLDFFTAAPFEGDDLLRVLDQYYAVTIMAQAKNTLTVSLDSVKVDFIRHDYLIIKPVSVINELRIASPEDIGAMKLNSITNRGRRRISSIFMSCSAFSFINLVRILRTKVSLCGCLDCFEEHIVF